MELYEFQKQLMSKQLDRFYIFTGEEIGIMNVYIQKIPFPVVRLDDVSDAYRAMSKSGKISQNRCYVVRDDMSYFKSDDLWDKVQSGFNKSKDTLIVVYTKMDKRSKFYKKYQKDLVVFDKLDTSILSKYVTAKLPDLSGKEIKFLVENVCENDYSHLMNELDKINTYVLANNNSISNSAAFKKMIEDGTIHSAIGDITFQFTDAIVMRDYSTVSDLLPKIRQKKESEIMILSVLYDNLKQIFMVQSLGNGASEICKRTGLTPWQAKMAKSKMGYYDTQHLLDSMEIVRSIEVGVKTGSIPSEISLEYAILGIMRGE